MVKICTHRRRSSDMAMEQHVCKYCPSHELLQPNASYWTQSESGYEAGSKCIFHCQAHRMEARKEIALEIAS